MNNESLTRLNELFCMGDQTLIHIQKILHDMDQRKKRIKEILSERGYGRPEFDRPGMAT